MKRTGSFAIVAAAAVLSLLPVIAQQPQPGGRGGPGAPGGGRGGRGPAQPPPELTAEQKGQYQSKIDELDSMAKGLRSKKVNEDLIADVDIYAKAGKWLLEFLQCFANPKGIVTYLAVLAQRLERGSQLQKGQSP